jgi:hypothetical protein
MREIEFLSHLDCAGWVLGSDTAVKAESLRWQYENDLAAEISSRLLQDSRAVPLRAARPGRRPSRYYTRTIPESNTQSRENVGVEGGCVRQVDGSRWDKSLGIQNLRTRPERRGVPQVLSGCKERNCGAPRQDGAEGDDPDLREDPTLRSEGAPTSRCGTARRKERLSHPAAHPDGKLRAGKRAPPA